MNTLEVMPTIGKDLDYVPEGLAEAQQGFIDNATGVDKDKSCTVQPLAPTVGELKYA